MATKIFIRQVRSMARTKEAHKRTLRALGLGKIGKSRTITDNTAVRGMIRAVVQWLEVKHVQA
ncbi:MAG: 50S ribosomal protein L30 [Proteobacteria bacterium]|jgi:large subunit ribosomal protein L30|nr:50S ribosomal protein L30 [Pseudomonadota bacterium]